MIVTSLIAAALITGGPSTLHEFSMKDIDGKPTSLGKFKGKVVLVVNVASKCGLTPQYEGLEALYKEFKDKGLVVLGFPANNFGGQEPGTETEIKQFCTAKYNVTFPMFSKISVNGEDTDPLYKWLIAQSKAKDPIAWNFAKFIVGRDGKVIERFAPQTKPSAPAFREAIVKALR